MRRGRNTSTATPAAIRRAIVPKEGCGGASTSSTEVKFLLHARLRRKIESNMNKRSAAWVPDGFPRFSPGSRNDASFDRSEVILREGGVEIRIVEIETNRE
jgi:endo-beta-N-acetylglucosaminidase D